MNSLRLRPWKFLCFCAENRNEEKGPCAYYDLVRTHAYTSLDVFDTIREERFMVCQLNRCARVSME